MTRHGFGLGVALALALAACGGSSSETPPPLEPDPHGFHYAGAPLAEREATDAGSLPSADETDDDGEKPPAPAHSTWGGNAPIPH